MSPKPPKSKARKMPFPRMSFFTQGGSGFWLEKRNGKLRLSRRFSLDTQKRLFFEKISLYELSKCVIIGWYVGGFSARIGCP